MQPQPVELQKPAGHVVHIGKCPRWCVCVCLQAVEQAIRCVSQAFAQPAWASGGGEEGGWGEGQTEVVAVPLLPQVMS